MTSPAYNLTPYNSITVSFKFRAEGMENGEDFWLRYFDGSTWSTISSFTAGTDFGNNQVYTVTITYNSNFGSASKFRFQCDASDNDDNIYIDAVVISGSSSSSIQNIEIVESFDQSYFIPRSTALNIYPNPVHNVLNIQTNEEIHEIAIFNISGQIVKHVTENFQNGIDLSEINSGLYIIRIDTDEHSYTEKIFKATGN